jgi:hypothetical protein
MQPNPITLSNTDPIAAQEKFNELLQEPSGTLTLILILGANETAQVARQYATNQVQNFPGSYKSVEFVVIQNPAFVLDILKQLTVRILDPNHPLDWENYDDLTVIAISPAQNIIADVLTRHQVNTAAGLIKLSILHALGIEHR